MLRCYSSLEQLCSLLLICDGCEWVEDIGTMRGYRAPWEDGRISWGPHNSHLPSFILGKFWGHWGTHKHSSLFKTWLWNLEFFDPIFGHLMARHLLLNFEKVIVYTVCHGKVVIIGDQTSVGIINLSQFRINIWTKHKLWLGGSKCPKKGWWLSGQQVYYSHQNDGIQ